MTVTTNDNMSELQDVVNIIPTPNMRNFTNNHQFSQSQQNFKQYNPIEKKTREGAKTPQKSLTNQQKKAVHQILSPFQKYRNTSFVPLASSRTQRSITQNGQMKIDISPIKKTNTLSRSQYVLQQIEKESLLNVGTPVKTQPNYNMTSEQKAQQSSKQTKIVIDNLAKQQNELDTYLRKIEEKTKEKIMLQKDIHEIKKEVLFVQDDIFKLKKSKQNFKDEDQKFRKNIEKLNQDKCNIQQEDKNVAQDIYNLEQQIDEIKLKAKDISDNILLETDVIKDLIERIGGYKKQVQFIQKDKDKTRVELLKKCKQMQRLEIKLIQYSKESNNLFSCLNFKQQQQKK